MLRRGGHHHALAFALLFAADFGTDLARPLLFALGLADGAPAFAFGAAADETPPPALADDVSAVAGVTATGPVEFAAC